MHPFNRKSILILVGCLVLLFAREAQAAPPSISNLSPTSGAVGASVTITGTNFGSTKGTSTVKFNGTIAATTSWSATRRPASNGIVQRFRPAGGVLHASATQKASCLPSNFCRVPGRLRSVSAFARPSSTNRWRVRWTGARPTRKGAAMSSSGAPSAAWRSLWARAT